MSVDAERGIIRFFEDFVGKDVVADNPEWGVDTDPAVEIVATGIGGVVRVTCDAGQTNIGGITFGQTQWSAYDNYLLFQARVKISALGTASERVFVGLTDVQEDTLSEMPFTGATTVLTASGNPDDAIGFFWEGDMTGAHWVPGSIKSDAVIVQGASNMDTVQKRLATIVAGQWHTLSMRIENEARHVVFLVDGREVYRYKSDTIAAIADVPLIPLLVCTEGAGAMDVDLDYISCEMGRDN